MNHLLSIGLLLLSTLPALAQPWDILRATYGNRGTWIDVTDRVRSLASSNMLQFIVNAESMGGDPLPDVVKTLQISVRDATGRTGQYSFKDAEQVSLPVRSGKGPVTESNTVDRGRVDRRVRGGALVIIRAEYGDGRRMADLTQTLNNVVNGDRLELQITNSTMGGDPAPATSKQLRVRYQYNGREYDATVRENDWLRIPGGASSASGGRLFGGSSRGLRITSAEYGDGRRMRDVTQALNNAIRGNRLELQVTNNSMGGDPAPAEVKQLRVRYEYNGRDYNITVRENDWLRLPEGISGGFGGGGFQTSGLVIERAEYGEGSRILDVTQRLQSQVQNDRVSLKITNQAMGGDPAIGADKRLTVIYRWNGRTYQANVDEDKTLNLPNERDTVLR